MFSTRSWRVTSLIYAALVMLLGAYLNYTQPYDSGPTAAPSAAQLLLWSLLYVPLLALPLLANWEIKPFGFSVNPYSLAAALFFSALCGLLLVANTTSWTGAACEAFARTGEELFFRGFLFLLLLRLFENQRRPWLWAALVSSLLFALVHTQTFQPGYFHEGSNPLAFSIVQRLFNVFLIGLVLALLRHFTQSILPGSVIHSLLQAGPQTLPFVFLLHAAAVLWAFARKEKVFDSGVPHARFLPL